MKDFEYLVWMIASLEQLLYAVLSLFDENRANIMLQNVKMKFASIDYFHPGYDYAYGT
jgi:hypothetical protein